MTLEECKKEIKRLENKGIKTSTMYCDSWFDYLLELKLTEMEKEGMSLGGRNGD